MIQVQEPLLQDKQKQRNTGYKAAGLAVIMLIAACCLLMGGTNVPKAAELLQISKPIELDDLYNIDSAYSDIKKVSDVTSTLIDMAKGANDLGMFEDATEALSFAGPEMAIAGGFISLVGDIFGLGGPSQSQINERLIKQTAKMVHQNGEMIAQNGKMIAKIGQMIQGYAKIEIKQLNQVINGVHDIEQQLSVDFKDLNLKLDQYQCASLMHSSVSKIRNAVTQINTAKPSSQDQMTEIETWGSDCISATNDLLDILTDLDPSCNYFHVIQKGTGVDAIWQDNIKYMRSKYAQVLLQVSQGIACSGMYQAYLMRDTWNANNLNAKMKAWYEKDNWGSKYQNAAKTAIANLKHSNEIQKTNQWIQDRLDTTFSYYTSINGNVHDPGAWYNHNPTLNFQVNDNMSKTATSVQQRFFDNTDRFNTQTQMINFYGKVTSCTIGKMGATWTTGQEDGPQMTIYDGSPSYTSKFRFLTQNYGESQFWDLGAYCNQDPSVLSMFKYKNDVGVIVSSQSFLFQLGYQSSIYTFDMKYQSGQIEEHWQVMYIEAS